MKKIRILLLALLVTPTVWAQQDAAQFKQFANEILWNGKCYTDLRALCKSIGNRLSGSPAAAKAVAWGLQKMKEAGVNVWLVNTGWTGGPYGIGTRMKLKYTRAMITAAIDGSLEKANADNYHIHSVFGLQQPRTCPNVPSQVLSPRSTWNNDKGYYETAHKLAASFKTNFKKFKSYANKEIMEGGPKV